ncbi:THAP domain-containing protein 4 [Merluccius polli]|uniref:THAP domain-containing protein 4 n=1 Tax=Merluccius polli TaxID=89951 RepID=A0AA47N0A7_MERPO|nr:THAP domain-containing protein 4 [Merluccius polli]
MVILGLFVDTKLFMEVAGTSYLGRPTDPFLPCQPIYYGEVGAGFKPLVLCGGLYPSPGLQPSVGCNNSRKRNPGMIFYSLPREKERRYKWLAAIRRDLWTPTSNTLLCSEHFLSGAKQDNPLSPDFVPSLFAHTSKREGEKQHYAFQKFQKTQLMKRKIRENCSSLADPSTTGVTDMEEHEVTTDHHTDHSYSRDTGPGIVEPCMNPSCQAVMFAMESECTRLRAEVCELRARVEERSLNEEAFRDNDTMVQELTGLPSFAKLIIVFNFLSTFLKVGKSITPFQCLILTLMRLRLNVPLHFLAFFFGISKSTSVRVFNNTLDVMFFRLSELILWPSKEQIQISLPMCFRNNFKNCTSIIDCFEIFIEKSSNLRYHACYGTRNWDPKAGHREAKTGAQTYSQYKHHNTVKFLISITPQGVISYVSKGWGGRTSGKHITENCGYLDKLSPGDVILADRGFNVKDTMGLYCAQLKIPAFTKGKAQMHPLELEATRGLAAVRIHVERVIGLVRNKYTILQTTIPLTLCQASSHGEPTSIDKIVTVCCALCNVCPSIVPTE